MKILFLFCDMVRVEMFKSLNPSIKSSTSFEDYLENMGGTFFKNCYTPAPDTPRSIACLLTGLYPNKNGCDSRIKWPKFYLKENIPNIFTYLLENNFKINTLINERRLRVGLLPNRHSLDFTNYKDLESIIKAKNKILNDKDSLTFLDFPDYHFAVDDFCGDMKAHNYGLEKLLNSLKIFFSSFNFDDFDEIFLFSDHGCVFSNDKDKIYNNICDKRSKILMLHRSKFRKEFTYNDNLCSIMDVFPTIHEKLGVKSKINFDGSNLYKSTNHIVLEDNTSFMPSLNTMNNLWGVRYNDFFFIFYNDLIYSYEVDKEHLLKFREKNIEPNFLDELVLLLDKHTSSWLITKKHKTILKKYKSMKLIKPRYNDGSKRASYRFTYFYKIKSSLNKLLSYNKVKSIFKLNIK